MTTAIYARISDDRADGAGVSRQLTDCRELCKRRRWSVTATNEYVDNSLTASKSGVRRPAYQAMLASVMTGDVQRIVCYMIDRLYRQPRELEDLIDLAIAGRVEVVTAHGGEAIDLSSIDGATMARVSVAFAAGESRKISARVKRQQADRRAKGLHHGAARPLGYERVEGRFVPKLDEVALITKAMQSVLGGMSLANIAAEWTRLGIEHPQTSRKDPTLTVYPWHAVSVGAILHSSRNIGRMTNARSEDVGAGEWPAIVPSELFEACNATIAQRRTRGTASPGARGMLTGLIHCGACGSRLRRGRNAHMQYYRCPGSSAPGACGTVGIKADFVEELTLDTLRERLRGHNFRAEEGDNGANARLLAIDRQIGRHERQIERLTAEFVDSRGYTSQARVFHYASTQIEHTITKLRSERETLMAVSPVSVYGDINALMQDWDIMTADQQHTIIEAVLTRITVAHVGRGKWPVETMRRRVTFG